MIALNCASIQIYEWATGQHLFHPYGQGEWNREDDLLASITETLERPIPLKMIEHAKDRTKFFKDDGKSMSDTVRAIGRTADDWLRCS
jgi:hypothetical protein